VPKSAQLSNNNNNKSSNSNDNNNHNTNKLYAPQVQKAAILDVQPTIEPQLCHSEIMPMVFDSCSLVLMVQQRQQHQQQQQQEQQQGLVACMLCPVGEHKTRDVRVTSAG